MTTVEQVLIDTNKIVGQLVPLVGIVSLSVRATIALLKTAGKNAEAKVFEEELATADAQLAALGETLADFHRRYPKRIDPTDDKL